MPATLHFDHSGLLSQSVGAKGLTQAQIDTLSPRIAAAVENLRKSHATNEIAFLHAADGDADIAELESILPSFLNGASDVVMLGTGGSSLGGQTLVQLKNWHTPAEPFVQLPFRLHFLDNLDAFSMEAILKGLNLKSTRFIAISKSGGTGETLLQVSAVISALQAAGLEKQISQLFLGLSEPDASGQKNALRKLLAPYGVKFLEHSTTLGGRFSVMSNVGMLPAVALGLDARAIRAGALETLNTFLNAQDPLDIPAAYGAMAAIGLSEAHGLNNSVMMAYSDRLERFTAWYVQLWSESLGKQGKGLTPVRALGPVDQHSSVQLFVDGPKDKNFTIITVGCMGQGPRIAPELAERFGDPVFSGRTIGDLVAAQGTATADTLVANGQPTRRIHIPVLNEHALGALLMHFMIETALSALLLDIDAYDQPAVEEGKKRAKAILAG